MINLNAFSIKQSPWSRIVVMGTIAVLFLLAACGDDSSKTAGGTEEDSGIVAIEDKTISGVSQKGPFVNGSSVTIQALNGETLAQTGRSYQGKIKNDQGEFSVSIESLVSPYVVLKANGFYRNENTGEKSKAPVELFALSDISNRDEVNVNLLTHLEYERSLYLASVDSMTVAAAKKQAEKEVLTSFGIEGDFANSEDLSIFGKGDESAALLAISILMQGDLNEADFSERLADYAADIEVDGKWDDAKTATEIADWGAAKSLGQSLSYIRTKITDWGLSAEVPAFEKYVDNYWWQNYGLGTCEENREGEIKKNENSQSRNYKSYFICENGAWRVASDTEYDTYQQKCDEDGKIVFGNINKAYAYDCDAQRWRHASNVEAALGGCVEKRFSEVAETEGVYYICQKREWRTTTDIEKDTYGWKIGNDADVKYGDVVKTNCYVFEESVWRSGNDTDCSLGLRGCTTLRQDTVGKGGDNVWYICDSQTWRTATDIEKDTAVWGAGEFDGEVRAGQINKTTYYIYEISSNAWRNATTIEIDTYDYANNTDWSNGGDGEIKKGAITDTIYVFDATGWRIADDIEKVLGGCVASIRDSVGKVDNTYYICDPRKWNIATTLQYDTYKRECSRDGKMFNGNVNTTVKYVCDNENFRLVDSLEIVADSACTSYNRDVYYIPSRVLYYDEVHEMLKVEKNYSYYKCESTGWTFTTEKLNQGVMTDLRDNHIYKTIGIKSQIWMAENLNYADSVTYPSMLKRNWCYENESDNCEKYGRLYTWSAVIDSVYWSRQNKECGYRNNEEYEDNITCGLPNKVQGICPNGWSVPSDSAWFVLLHNVRHYKTEDLLATGSSVGGTVGWKWKNATDKFGFSILATGVYYNGRYNEGVETSDFQFLGMDSLTYFWHSTEYNCCNAGYGDFSYYGSVLNNAKYNGFSVRCIKDDDLP